MRTFAPRSAALFLAWSACVGLAQEPAVAVKKLTENLAGERKVFAKAEEKAKADLVATLKKLEDAAVRLDRTALGKARRESIRGEREAFEKVGTLPGSDEALPAVYAYAAALHKARPRLRQAHERLAEACGKGGDKAAERKARADLAAFEAAIPGLAEFTAGSKWNGILQKPHGTTNVSLSFGRVNDVLATGRVCLDNNWCQMDLEGLREGPRFVLGVKKMVIGAPQSPTFSGFVLGDRMLVEVNGLKGKKGPVSGLAVLTRAGK